MVAGIHLASLAKQKENILKTYDREEYSVTQQFHMYNSYLMVPNLARKIF